MNIYRFWTMQQQTENARIYDHIGDELVVVDYDELYEINKDIYKWPLPSKGHYKSILKFASELKECIIPYRLVQFCRYDDINAAECFCLVQWKHELIGLIQFHWGSEFVYNYCLSASSSERCCVAQIYSKTLLSNPLNIKNVDIPNKRGIKYIPLIEREKILKKEGQNVIYKKDIVHNIGFVKHEVDDKLQGDYKELGILKGNATSSAFYCCISCYGTSKHCKQDPTPSNRSAKPRYDGADLEALQGVDRVEKDLNPKKKVDYKKTLGNKYGSVCKIYGHNYGSSNIHLFGGKCGRYVKDLKALILKLDVVDNDLIKQYDEQQKKLFILRSELRLYQRQQKRVNRFNKENGSDKHSNDKDIIDFHFDDNGNYKDVPIVYNNNISNNQINNKSNNKCKKTQLITPKTLSSKSTKSKKSKKKPRFILHNQPVDYDNHHNLNIQNTNVNQDNLGDNDDDSDISDLEVNYLIDHIEKLQQDIGVVEAKILDLTTAMDLNTDRLKVWNKYKKDAGFEELDYRDNEITGPNALKFVDSWDHLRQPLQQISPKAAEICKYLFPLLKFLVHVSCHKNVLPLDDETIILHKFAVIEEEYVGRQLTRVCRNKLDCKELAVGIKGHQLYHEHSKMEWTRMTGAHFGDQRPENGCKMSKCYIRENRNQLTKQRVRTVVMKMNCEHALYYDTTNTR